MNPYICIESINIISWARVPMSLVKLSIIIEEIYLSF